MTQRPFNFDKTVCFIQTERGLVSLVHGIFILATSEIME